MPSNELRAVALIARSLYVRAKVILKAAPTWLAVAVVAAPVIADQAATVLPTAWAADVTSIGGRVAVIATALVTVIRRLTPVAPADRGLV